MDESNTFSGSKLGKGQREDILKRLNNLKYWNLHNEIQESEKALKNLGYRSTLGKLYDRIQDMLYSIQISEPNQFFGLPCFGNLLTLLYLNNGDDEEANDLNNKVQEVFPDDVTALLNKTYILLEIEDLKEADKILQYLEHNSRPQFQFFSGMVDVAFLYYYYPPHFYGKSVQLFETALEGIRQLPNNDAEGTDLDMMFDIQNVVVIWKYYLIATYNRLINSGNIMAQLEDSKHQCLTPVICFEKINSLTKEIVSMVLNKEKEKYVARALIDLYDAHHKMKFSQQNECNCVVCISETGDYLISPLLHDISRSETRTRDTKARKSTVNNCDIILQQAIQFCPNDAHVLEKIGRIKRTKATSLDHFKEAEAVFKTCVENNPDRHVAWHQLGLTYKSMWIYSLNKELYKNPIRKGSKTKKKTKASKGDRDDIFCSLATVIAKSSKSNCQENIENQQTNSIQMEKPCLVESKVVNQESLGKNIKSQNGVKVDEDRDCSLVYSRTESQELDKQTTSMTFQSKYKKDFGKQPKQYKRGDWFDKLRTKNPQYHGEEVPYYLKEAKRCFQKATGIVNDTHCRLLIDLGRCYVSMKCLKDAEKCYKKAKTCKSGTDYNFAYLYEQWAMLLQQDFQSEVRVFKHSNLEKIKSLYRQSVEFAVKSKERSRVAFYKLKDILFEEIQSHPEEENICVKEEYALLEKVVQNYHNAKNIIQDDILSKEMWKGDPELRSLAWHLVDIFLNLNQFTDAWHYMKMNLLLVAEVEHRNIILNVGLHTASAKLHSLEDKSKLNLPSKPYEILPFCSNEDYIEAQRLFGSLYENESQDIYTETFTTLIKLHHCPSRPKSMVNLSNQDKEIILPRSLSVGGGMTADCDILLVLQSENYSPPGFYEIKLLLQHCGFTIHDDLDVLPGSNKMISTKYEQLANHSTAILIFSDKIDQITNLCSTAWSLFDDIEARKTLQPIACLHYDCMNVSNINEKMKTIYTEEFVQAITENDGEVQRTATDKLIDQIFQYLCIDYFREKSI